MPNVLQLSRPLAVIDLETTGTDCDSDRIVEICVVKLHPDGTKETKVRLINPQRSIPAEATACHTITNEMVANEPPFCRIAKGLLDFLEGCDLCCYNSRFDIQMLRMEFQRAEKLFSMEGRAIVDPMMIYHFYEKRDLKAAVKFYLNRDFEDSHRAEADVMATIEVLESMLTKYPDLPQTPHEIFHRHTPSVPVDIGGKFRRSRDGEIEFTFGQHRGKSIDWAAKNERQYMEWILGSDMAMETKQLVREALNRNPI